MWKGFIQSKFWPAVQSLPKCYTKLTDSIRPCKTYAKSSTNLVFHSDIGRMKRLRICKRSMVVGRIVTLIIATCFSRRQNYNGIWQILHSARKHQRNATLCRLRALRWRGPRGAFSGDIVSFGRVRHESWRGVLPSLFRRRCHHNHTPFKAKIVPNVDACERARGDATISGFHMREHIVYWFYVSVAIIVWHTNFVLYYLIFHFIWFLCSFRMAHHTLVQTVSFSVPLLSLTRFLCCFTPATHKCHKQFPE